MGDGSYDFKDNSLSGISISTGNENKIVEFLKKFDFKHKSKGDYRLTDISLARFVYSFFGRVNSHTKRVPKLILTAQEEDICSFLKGYFSADGSIHTSGKKRIIIDCSSCNLGLLQDIQFLLNRLKIKCNITDGYSNRAWGKTYGPNYKLVIEGKKFIYIFLEKINFVKDFKPHLMDILRKQGCKQEKNQILSLRSIRNIQYIGNKHVYDLKMPDTEIFISEGIVCHNSGSAIIDENNNFVGRLNSGNGTHTFGIPAPKILQKLKLSIENNKQKEITII